MSILACHREFCMNNGDRYSCVYGRICEECFEELAALWACGNTIDIDLFMESEKDTWMSRPDLRPHLEKIFTKDES